MSFLDLLERLPGASISPVIFKKKFQVCLCGRSIAFHEDDHVPSRPLHQAPKLVRALGGIAGQNAPFAQHPGKPWLERTDFIVLQGHGTLLQDHPGLDLIHMQHVLLRGLSPIHLFAGAASTLCHQWPGGCCAGSIALSGGWAPAHIGFAPPAAPLMLPQLY